MQDSEEPELVYQEVMHKFISSDPSFNDPSTGLNGYLIDADEELEYKEFSWHQHFVTI